MALVSPAEIPRCLYASVSFSLRLNKPLSEHKPLTLRLNHSALKQTSSYLACTTGISPSNPLVWNNRSPAPRLQSQPDQRQSHPERRDSHSLHPGSSQRPRRMATSEMSGRQSQCHQQVSRQSGHVRQI